MPSDCYRGLPGDCRDPLHRELPADAVCQCGPGHPANGTWCYICELPAEVTHGVQ